MKCANCGHENDAGAKFCYSCGTKVQEAPATGGYGSSYGESLPPAPPAPPAMPESPAGGGYGSPYGESPLVKPPATTEYPAGGGGYGTPYGGGAPAGDGYGQGYGGGAPAGDGYGQAYGGGAPAGDSYGQGYGGGAPGQPGEPGQPQQYPPYPGQPAQGGAKPLPLKKILMIGIPAVIIIIALVIGLSMSGGGSGGSAVKDSISFFSDGDAVIVSGNNNPKFTIDGKLYTSKLSLDRTKGVVMTDYSNSGGTLWFVTTSKSTKIADDVTYGFAFSDSGNAVAYMTDLDSKNGVAALYLYNTATKKITKLSDEAVLGSVCISPNGKSVGYASDYKRDENKMSGYISIDGKIAEKLGDNAFAQAISNGGKYVYYAKLSKDSSSASLWVKSGRNDTKLMSEVVDDNFILNMDYSQLIFNIDGKAYVSQNGKEREQICKSGISVFLMPHGTQSVYSNGATVYGVSSFKNTLAMSGDGMVYINNKFASAKISGSTTSTSYVSVSTDGKTLIYISGSGVLASINPSKPDADKKEIGKKVQSFVASSDGKTVYFVNEDKEMYYSKGGGKAVKVSDDVYSDSLAMSSNGSMVFFLADYSYKNGGTLYYSSNGSKRTKAADDIVSVWSTPTSIFYRTVDSDIYRSNGNAKFTLLLSDAK